MSQEHTSRILDGVDATMNPISAEISSQTMNTPGAAVAPIKRRWLSNFILTFTIFADGNESGIVSALFVLISKDLGLGLATLGILTALGKIISALFGPLWAVLA